MQIGAQLFTLREYCKTLEDFSLTLKRVADMGYGTVQVSGTCAYDPAWLRDQLKANGLRCVLTHIPADRLQNDPEQVARDHTIFDCDCVGLGFYSFKPESPENTPADFMRKYAPVGAALRQAGKYFMYHNHDSEFCKFEGKTALQHLAEGIPAEDMGFTVDTFWVQAGGGDPAQWIENLAGRVTCIHLKDYGYGRRMEAIGEGNINFDRVFAAAEAAGTQYMLVEQDHCNGEDPFECLRRSRDFLVSRGFR